MKVKQATQYQMHEYTRPTIIFYCVMVFIFLASFVAAAIISGSIARGRMMVQMGSVSTSSVVFLFILGMNSFKNPFRMYLQNGISRRTQLVGFILSMLCLSAVMTLVDNVIFTLIFKNLIGYEVLFSEMYGAGTGFGYWLTSTAWTFVEYGAAMCFGFLITTLFYRMSKPVKVLVSAGVPLLLFVVLPMLEAFIPSFSLFSDLFWFIQWALGINMVGFFSIFGNANTTVYPLRAVCTFSVVIVASIGLAWLLMRRATLKDA